MFDWDDTLYPTTAIKRILKQTPLKLSSQQISDMCKFSKLVYTVLNCYIMDFNVVIVTASEKGWIQQSLMLIMKFVKNGHFSHIFNLLFVSNKIKMIHPKKEQLPFRTHSDCASWKAMAFRAVHCLYFEGSESQKPLISNHRSDAIIISIGDSYSEYLAAKQINDSCRVHRIKLMETPTMKEIIEGLECVKQHRRKYGENEINVILEKKMNYEANRLMTLRNSFDFLTF